MFNLFNKKVKLHSCPCCHTRNVFDTGDYAICKVCNWENDPIQLKDPDYAGGANKMSLNQSRLKFKSKSQTKELFEARTFLLKSKTSLALNRFPVKKDAQDFVDILYTLGAKDVSITGIRSYVSEDDMSCDELIVLLPEDTSKRKTLFDIYSKELMGEGFQVENDNGQKEIKFWWN